MKNKTIIIDGVILPIVENEEGVIYYPVKYTFQKILLKAPTQLHKVNRCKEYIKKYIIDYTFKGTTPQETSCITGEGFSKYISTMKLNGMTLDKKKRHNLFCDIIGCDNKYINEYEGVELYDEYVKDSIELFVKDNPNIEFKICIACGRELPIHSDYFIIDNRVNSGISNSCKQCSDNHLSVNHKDMYAKKVYVELGLEAYKLYRDDIVNFYIKHCHNKDLKLLIKDNLLETVCKILKIYYGINEITGSVLKTLNIANISTISVNSIIESISKGDCRKRPWLYPHSRLGSISKCEGIEILKRYILENNIIIDNVLEYPDYENLIRDARLTQLLGGKRGDKFSSLSFIVMLYDYKYAGYQFRLGSNNYYLYKENRIFDMRHLIEKDLKIPIHKIPLYITKYVLHRDYSSLYHVLVNKYNNLFEWIDECYPGEFIVHDFVINPYRSEFDSLEEAQVHDILKRELKNVIYNCRSNENYINIDGMIPDWLIINNTSCILVEYFGLYTEGDVSSSHRLERYRYKMAIKLEKYERLIGYDKLFIYPEDLKNDFKGLRDKIFKIA